MFPLALAALAMTSCDSSGSTTANATTSEAATSRVATTSTFATPPPPPPLTHRQFIHRLDNLCKRGNRATDRRFKSEVTVYETAESMDAYARLLRRSQRFIRRWDQTHGFFMLDPGDPKDVRDYKRYKELTRRSRNLYGRAEAAARHHDYDEIFRVLRIANQTRNQRTKLTADMGLRFCGS
jgi:hypothetical protein